MKAGFVALFAAPYSFYLWLFLMQSKPIFVGWFFCETANTNNFEQKFRSSCTKPSVMQPPQSAQMQAHFSSTKQRSAAGVDTVTKCITWTYMSWQLTPWSTLASSTGRCGLIRRAKPSPWASPCGASADSTSWGKAALPGASTWTTGCSRASQPSTTTRPERWTVPSRTV